MQKQDWELLCALKKTGSLSKASEMLFISQPALTRRLRSIEEEFGVLVATRSGKGIALTPQGEILAAYSMEMLERYRQIQTELTEGSEIRGKLHIAASLSQTQFLLPGLMQAFSAKYPGIRYQLESLISSQAAAALTARKAQIAFFCGSHTGGFKQLSLMKRKAYAVYGKPFVTEELSALPFISYTADPVSVNLRNRWWYEHFQEEPLGGYVCSKCLHCQ